MGLIKFDGLYCRIQSETGNSILRFYDDGTVIGVTIGREPEEPQKSLFPSGNWFDKDSGHGGLSRGTYCVSPAGNISFKTKSRSGVVDYNGTVETDEIILDIHSHINGNKTSGAKYVFYSYETTDGNEIVI